jgi:hypothetical protein
VVNRRRWLLPMLGALVLPTATVALPVHSYRGEARLPGGEALLYEEHHLLRRDAEGQLRDRLVLYRCPDGAAFARKDVRYGGTAQAPEFALFDARFGYREGYELGSSFVQRSARSPLQRKPVAAAGEALVIDAGFDEFVRARWDELQGGEALRFEFLVPSRLSSFGFRLSKVGSEALDGEPATVFRLALSGVLGWFADAIEVSYRDSDRRLMRFAGMTNIRRDSASNLVARIEFPPAREAAADDAAWQAAEREPLVDCRLGS